MLFSLQLCTALIVLLLPLLQNLPVILEVEVDGLKGDPHVLHEPAPVLLTRNLQGSAGTG